jgi:hypothetical protein
MNREVHFVAKHLGKVLLHSGCFSRYDAVTDFELFPASLDEPSHALIGDRGVGAVDLRKIRTSS